VTRAPTARACARCAREKRPELSAHEARAENAYAHVRPSAARRSAADDAIQCARSLEAIHCALGVMSAGRWRTQRQLDELLTEQKSRYDRVLQ
jgi:hypothetical protein